MRLLLTLQQLKKKIIVFNFFICIFEQISFVEFAFYCLKVTSNEVAYVQQHIGFICIFELIRFVEYNNEIDGSPKNKWAGSNSFLSEPGFDPGTCGLWAHHASAAPL
jgi:hypothetical protein